MSIRTQTPVEIDTELSRIWEAEDRLRHHFAHSFKVLDEWDVSARRNHFRGDKQHYIDQVAKLEAKIAVCRAEAEPFEAEFARRGGWRRFFLVTNQNGHIHTSMNCTTCFHDTQYAWLPGYSAMTDEEIVGLEAYRCCTVCMPVAPAEQKAARAAHTKAQREAKAAERQAKADTKDAKGRERASKLVDKVEAAIEKIGGWEVFCDEYATHTARYPDKKSLYEWRYVEAIQQTVGDVLDDIKSAQEGDKYGLRNLNKYVKAELTTRGLI